MLSNPRDARLGVTNTYRLRPTWRWSNNIIQFTHHRSSLLFIIYLLSTSSCVSHRQNSSHNLRIESASDGGIGRFKKRSKGLWNPRLQISPRCCHCRHSRSSRLGRYSRGRISPPRSQHSTGLSASLGSTTIRLLVKKILHFPLYVQFLDIPFQPLHFPLYRRLPSR